MKKSLYLHRKKQTTDTEHSFQKDNRLYAAKSSAASIVTGKKIVKETFRKRKGKKMKTLRMIIKKIAMLWKESSEMMYKDAQYRMFV